MYGGDSLNISFLFIFVMLIHIILYHCTLRSRILIDFLSLLFLCPVFFLITGCLREIKENFLKKIMIKAQTHTKRNID